MGPWIGAAIAAMGKSGTVATLGGRPATLEEEREHFDKIIYVDANVKRAECRNCGAPRKLEHDAAACHYCGVVR